ncbi:MAG: hypothetical protein GWN58_62155 [Anaerolineae bacterium]|nr:hypothetical protein [Anaerolineae bacterium]
MDSSKGEYHRELGIVQMRNPRWQKPAETALSRAIEIEQTDVRALVHLGLLYKKNGLKRRAVETFRQALQWDPENSVAVESLAQLEPSAEEPGGRLKGLFGRRP